MKVLFLVPYSTSGPSTRYRVEQYLPYLSRKDIDYKVSPFISEQFYKVVYNKGMYAKKIFYLFDSLKRRLLDVISCADFDVIFIHLEAFPFGPSLLERFFSALKKPIIFDLDDAIYLQNRIFVNRLVRILRYPQKIPGIIRLSSHIIVCNKFLKDYASQFKDENNITVIHTPIDTDKFTPVEQKKDKNNLVIGWIGSHTTAAYLDLLKNVFQKLAAKYNFILKIVGAGKEINYPGVNIINKEWALGEDVANFQSLDIGVYPLNDDEWVKGKTGFKTLQYMAVAVSCVASDVGRNKEIIQDGVNGFLAKTEKEWFDKISYLIEDKELREKIGLAGRKTVEERYSVKVNAVKFLEVIQRVRNKRNNRL